MTHSFVWSLVALLCISGCSSDTATSSSKSGQAPTTTESPTSSGPTSGPVKQPAPPAQVKTGAPGKSIAPANAHKTPKTTHPPQPEAVPSDATKAVQAPPAVTPAPATVSTAADLQGRWAIDAESLKKSAAFQKMSEKSQSLALAQLEQMKMIIVISADTITVHGQRDEDKFTDSTGYTISQQTGNSFTIKTDKKGRAQTQILTLRGEYLEVSEGGPKMIFKKVK